MKIADDGVGECQENGVKGKLVQSLLNDTLDSIQWANSVPMPCGLSLKALPWFDFP